MQDPITFADLRAQHRSLEPEISRALLGVVEAGAFVLGPQTRAFEQEFADYCGVAHCVGCASGSDALQLALQGLGIAAGHEVIVPAFTFFATAQAVLATGARPVFADVDEATGLIDPASVAAQISARTRAIVAVHLFGAICDMPSLARLAQRHDLRLLEDAAQAHGATQGELRAGSFGDAAAFSFYPGKNLGAYGDAGAVVTRSAQLDRWLRMARQHGSTRKFEHLFVGRNSRLDELQAAVLRVKLRRLEDWNRRRRRIAEQYDVGIRSLSATPLPATSGSARHLYVVRVGDRDGVLQRMRQHGIQCAVHYPSLAAHQPALRRVGVPFGAYPAGSRLCRQVLSLPIYPEMTDGDVQRVLQALQSSV